MIDYPTTTLLAEKAKNISYANQKFIKVLA
jgi:hypothetical protein